jgi:hypothetical protein
LEHSEESNNKLNQKLNSDMTSKQSSNQRLRNITEHLSDLNEKMEGRDKYSQYYSIIDENEEKGVVITNKVEMEKLRSANYKLTQCSKNIEVLT